MRPRRASASAFIGQVGEQRRRHRFFLERVARLPVDIGTPLGSIVRAGCETGEPTQLSLRALLRSPPRWLVHQREIYVCENPNLLASTADSLDVACSFQLPPSFRGHFRSGTSDCQPSNWTLAICQVSAKRRTRQGFRSSGAQRAHVRTGWPTRQLVRDLALDGGKMLDVLAVSGRTHP